ncbi:hypothetical protein D7Z26_07545 [Cohnella endophytica]|uniref:Fungal lipase-like domain-containing protein n=1 Tax=Cohnella endophytica TaxID=2419778 RepID=A0A494Y145_9BACL|nr:hypothetical protein [Cohnella endophytica]RKP55073.1 hypothetical protein D7Z26_07545 [Cohnella endophytica]
MRNDSTANAVVNYEIYMLAGFATAPRFMEGLRVAMRGGLERLGGRVTRAELLFPYGDWSRGKLPQLWEIQSDMRIGADESRVARSIGGMRAVESILSRDAGDRRGGENKEESDIAVLVGHSGGGIAALHAAQVLMSRGARKNCLVAMIGSPRTRIAEWIRPNVLTISASGRKGSDSKSGRTGDPVVWFGTHGYRDRQAPGTRVAVTIVGGHADYFREAAPYVDPNGKSNLDITLDAAMAWLTHWNRTSFR